MTTASSSTKEGIGSQNMNPKFGIVCAGLSCLDLQLIGCTKTKGQEEAIERYEEAIYCAGGSASMASTTLALLLKNDQENFAVHVLTKLGNDVNGNMMMEMYEKAGAHTDLSWKDSNAHTSMAVLPVFKAGGRGCFINLNSNEGFTVEELLGRLDTTRVAETSAMKAFLFGYPHLLPQMQGKKLKTLFEEVRNRLGQDCLIGLDLNGVSAESHRDDLLLPAMSQVDILHLNEEEAAILVPNRDVAALHEQGCAIVVLSLGHQGAQISITPSVDRWNNCPVHASHPDWKAGSKVRVPAFQIDHGAINTNGAGDALFSGFGLAASWDDHKSISLEQAGTFASLVAWQRCDVKTRDAPARNASSLMQLVLKNELPDKISID